MSPRCIVETGETSSTRRLSKHIESRTISVQAQVEPLAWIGRQRKQTLVAHFLFGLTRRRRGRTIRISVFAEHDTFLLPALPARQRPMRRRTVRLQNASLILLTPLRIEQSC